MTAPPPPSPRPGPNGKPKHGPGINFRGRSRPRIETAPLSMVREKDGRVIAFATDIHHLCRTAHALWDDARIPAAATGDTHRRVLDRDGSHVATIRPTRDLPRAAYSEENMSPSPAPAPPAPPAPKPKPERRASPPKKPHPAAPEAAPAPEATPPAEPSSAAAQRWISLRVPTIVHSRVLRLVDRIVRGGAIGRPTASDVLRAAIDRGLDALEKSA